MTMQHVINKFAINLVCQNEQQAFRMRKSFQKDFYGKAISIIEKCCDEESDNQHLFQIDRIEVNLKSTDSNNPNTADLLKSFEKLFKQEFKMLLSSSTKKKNITQSKAEALTIFLSTGNIPWWIDEKEENPDDWCNQIQLNTDGNNFIVWLKANYRQQAVWDRINIQLSPRFRTFIIQSIAELAEAARGLQNLYDQTFNSTTTPKHTDHTEANAINDFIITNGGKLLGNNQPSNNENLFISYLESILSEAEMDNLPPGINQKIKEANKLSEKHELESDWKIPTKTDDTIQTKIRTNRAGIILLSPFLKEFFQKMKLWQKGNWTDEHAQCRAVYLLNYLSTGEEFSFEYNLAFEKIMCGINPEGVLKEKVGLMQEEKAGAEELLTSVIEHWNALKNTSINGLRNTFLMREGSLSKKEDNWRLQVERMTVDVLLEQIPWGFRTIVLPWTPFIIYTEW